MELQVHDAVPETFLAWRCPFDWPIRKSTMQPVGRNTESWTEHRNGDPAAHVRGTVMFWKDFYLAHCFSTSVYSFAGCSSGGVRLT